MNSIGSLPMSPIQRAIERIRKLDEKEGQLNWLANAILQSSAMNQAPPIYGRTLDKILKIQDRKAVIWHKNLRTKFVPGTRRTIWQSAVAANLDVRRFGKENGLRICADDIEQLLLREPLQGSD